VQKNWQSLWWISVLFPYAVLAIVAYADGDSVTTWTHRSVLLGAVFISVCGVVRAIVISPFTAIQKVVFTVATLVVVYPVLLFVFSLGLILIIGPIQH